MNLRRATLIGAGLLAGWLWQGDALAQCRDPVVLVHGNTGHPSDFDNTYIELRARGYADSQIFRPNWGSKTCAACNDHNGSEGTPVLAAINSALAVACRGKIDVIGHSMGAMQAIANARRAPTRFAAVAALGGGGRIEAGDAISGVAFQVTVGSLDFARGPARALALALERNEADVEFVEVPDVGHVLVLQDALPRVFAWLDAPSKR